MRPPRGILVAGTTSDAGKTFVATALCRLLDHRGIPVQPFKAVNMSLNSVPAEDGGEIAVAQWLQSVAARVPALTCSNPVLLKSEGPGKVEVIVRGRTRFRVSSWRTEMPRILPDLRRAVLEAIEEVRKEGRTVVAEGAGSPVEMNLRDSDLSNFFTAEALDLNVLLVADLERGGSLAQVVGTLELLSPGERKRVKGIVLNRMRGDPRLVDGARTFLEERTGIPVLGVVPYLEGPGLPEEDSLSLPPIDPTLVPSPGKGPRIGILRYPHLSNFLDFPATWFGSVGNVRWVDVPQGLAGLDLLILPGSRRTRDDLHWMAETSLDDAIREAHGLGVRIAGVCGGYQMLGERLIDPKGFEGPPGESPGLGLLPIRTEFREPKIVRRVQAVPTGKGPLTLGSAPLEGYEIRRGRTRRNKGSLPLFHVQSRSSSEPPEEDGAFSPDGRVWGTAIHGLFSQPTFWKGVREWIPSEPPRGERRPSLAGGKGPRPRTNPPGLEEVIERSAALLEQNLDLPLLFRLLGTAPAADRKRRSRE